MVAARTGDDDGLRGLAIAAAHALDFLDDIVAWDVPKKAFNALFSLPLARVDRAHTRGVAKGRHGNWIKGGAAAARIPGYSRSVVTARVSAPHECTSQQ